MLIFNQDLSTPSLNLQDTAYGLYILVFMYGNEEVWRTSSCHFWDIIDI